MLSPSFFFWESNVIKTVISLNLLHCLKDVKTALNEIRRVLTENGNSAITTLVQGSRRSIRYLNMLAGSGALISRSQDELQNAFNDLQMEVTCEIKGNLAFIKYGY